MTVNDWLLDIPQTSQLYAVMGQASEAKAFVEYYRLGGGEHTPSKLYVEDYEDWLDVMPWLVPLARDNPFINWVDNTSSMDWGFLGVASSAQQEIIQHLRMLIKVKMPAGEEVFFKYWDGNFLSSLLNDSTEKEKKEIMGCFDQILVNKFVFMF